MCALEAAFFVPLGLGLAWSHAAARLARSGRPCGGSGIETWRSGFPFSGMPFGRLAYATADTPWADALPWIGMTGVSLLVALTGTTLAWLLVDARTHRRGRRTPSWPASRPSPLLPVAAALPGRARPARRPSRPCRATSRARGPTSCAVHRDVTANHVRLTEELADAVAAGEQAAARLRGLAGELHRRRPVHRRRGARRDRRRLRRHRRAGRGRRDVQRPARRHPGAQPGHRLPTRPRQRRPLHQAAPGALRRVHPLPRQPDPSRPTAS